MSTFPSWTDAEWTAEVAEPFRSDREFWSGLAASADAVVSLAAATAVSVVLVLVGQPVWAVVPFIVPAGFALRAAFVSLSSSRRNRAAFADAAQWRDAERTAVAASFGKALSRPRGGHTGD